MLRGDEREGQQLDEARLREPDGGEAHVRDALRVDALDARRFVRRLGVFDAGAGAGTVPWQFETAELDDGTRPPILLGAVVGLVLVAVLLRRRVVIADRTTAIVGGPSAVPVGVRLPLRLGCLAARGRTKDTEIKTRILEVSPNSLLYRVEHVVGETVRPGDYGQDVRLLCESMHDCDVL